MTAQLTAVPERWATILKKLNQLDELFEGCISNKRIQCASCILSREGKVFAHRSMGPLRPDTPDKHFLPDSLRRIASVH